MRVWVKMEGTSGSKGNWSEYPGGFWNGMQGYVGWGSGLSTGKGVARNLWVVWGVSRA